MRRITHATLLFIAALVLALGAQFVHAADDKAQLTGYWEGTDPSTGKVGGFEFKADGTVQTYTNGTAGGVMHYEVDLVKGTLDLIMQDGGGKEKARLLLLCKLENGKLTVQSGDDARVRPNAFDPKKAIEFVKKK